jgi:hypothetical protein
MEYDVYQITFTSEEREKWKDVTYRDDAGCYSDPKYNAYKESSSLGKQVPFKYYTKVATVTAYDLEDVFRIGNVPAVGDVIEKYSPMHSISVGDVIEDSAGLRWVVGDWGFKLMSKVQKVETMEEV